MPLDRSALLEALLLRYPLRDEYGIHLRARILDLCDDFIAWDLGDTQTEERLCSQDNAKHWQQFSEVLIAHQLWKAGYPLKRYPKGPDFLIEHEGRRIWIEVVTPEPNGLPEEWLDPKFTGCRTLPYEAITLRWTHAIKTKSEQLLGDGKKPGYLKDGVVGPDDAYVIAVNGYLLRSPTWVAIDSYGISGFTFAVEATFCVGPRELRLDRRTRKAASWGHQQRESVPKPNGAPVRTDTFFDPRFSPVSAIWAVDIDVGLLLKMPRPMAVVHNPCAKNPVPEGWLPAESEYVATDEGDEYLLQRRDGIMSFGSRTS